LLTSIVRKLTLFALVAIAMAVAAPAYAAPVPNRDGIAVTTPDTSGTIAFAQGNSDKDKGKDEKNKGKGNDNKDKGKSKKNGEEGKDKAQKDDDKGKDKDKEKGKDKKKKDIAPAEDFEVEVTCLYDASVDQTTCTIVGIAPEGSKKINFITMDQAAACAEVVGGEFNSESGGGVPSYKSLGDDATIVLIMEGEVTASGTGTYWFKVASATFPATGPGFECVDTSTATTEATQAPATGTSDPTPTPSEQDTSEPDQSSLGDVVVTTYTCTGVPADKASFDWYGECTPMTDPVSYELTAVDPAGAEVQLGSSDKSGATAFSDLAPGTYSLDLLEVSWCFAQSDNVRSDGDLNVVAGETTQVWIFVCGN
jgi:hypothetical protein